MHSHAPSPDTCYLYLVRHGATDNNLLHPPRLQGRADVELSDEGAAQAEQAGRFLAGLPIAAVYSSPLRRARQTSEAIARPHGLDVRSVDALIECDVGEWEGCTWPDIEREHPDAYRRFVTDPSRFGYLGGENLAQVLERVSPAFTQLMSENLGGQIVVTAHNVVNRAYLGSLLDIPIAKRRSVPQDNCCINVIRFRNDRSKVLTVNGLFHLEEWS